MSRITFYMHGNINDPCQWTAGASTTYTMIGKGFGQVSNTVRVQGVDAIFSSSLSLYSLFLFVLHFTVV